MLHGKDIRKKSKILRIDVNDDLNLPVLEYNVTHLIVYMYVLQNHFVRIMGFA